MKEPQLECIVVNEGTDDQRPDRATIKAMLRRNAELISKLVGVYWATCADA